MARALPLTLILLVAAPTLAQGWADVFEPERRGAERLVRSGLFHLALGLGSQGAFDDPAWLHLERALVRFDQAERVLPRDADLAYYQAQALLYWQRPAEAGGTQFRVEDAIAAFERVRAVDPDYMPARVAGALAVLYARRGQAARAAEEYERGLALALPRAATLMGRSYQPTFLEEHLSWLYDPINPATSHNNLAEMRMLLGHLDQAVLHYEWARDRARRPSLAAVAGFGLALALHRRGDREQSLSAAAHALALDPFARDGSHDALQDRWGALAVLHSDDQVFEPAYELHAYHAVAYEAFSRQPGVDRRAATEHALSAWRTFLATGGTASRFAAHARAQITRLEAALETTPAAPAAARARTLRSSRRGLLPISL